LCPIVETASSQMTAAKKRSTNAQPGPIPAVRTHVLIVDDHELLRQGLRMLLNNEPDMKVIGEAVDEADAKQAIRQLNPDVVIVDLKLRTGSGLDLIKVIRKQLPMVRILVCTMHDEKIYGERVLRAGANGFVNKHDSADTIVRAIREVQAGKLFFGEEFVNRVMRRAMADPNAVEKSPVEMLSDREFEVFRMVGQGLPTREIAKQLHLSSSTVDTYRERLKAKLCLKSGTELVRHATQWVLENT
jgi:DNA-binding NarL/FixJ family response regulator